MQSSKGGMRLSSLRPAIPKPFASSGICQAAAVPSGGWTPHVHVVTSEAAASAVLFVYPSLLTAARRDANANMCTWTVQVAQSALTMSQKGH